MHTYINYFAVMIFIASGNSVLANINRATFNFLESLPKTNVCKLVCYSEITLLSEF